MNEWHEALRHLRLSVIAEANRESVRLWRRDQALAHTDVDEYHDFVPRTQAECFLESLNALGFQLTEHPQGPPGATGPMGMTGMRGASG